MTFSNAYVAVSGLGPQPISLDIRPLTEPAGWRLMWDDNAFVYDVDGATNLLAPQEWVAVTNGLCQPVLIKPFDDANLPHFYRVKGTVY